MFNKTVLPATPRQPVPMNDKLRPDSSAGRFAHSRLVELQRVERKRLDRFGRFGGR